MNAIEFAARHYIDALKNDSPIVSRSHLVLIDYRKAFNDEQYEQLTKRIEEILK